VSAVPAANIFGSSGGSPPALPWLRICVLAIAVFGASLGCLEAFWRMRGFEPTVSDSKDLWYFWRQRLHKSDGRVIVFLGTSRIKADISIEIIQECLPNYRVVQLGLNGPVSCIGFLNDLAEDQSFKGIVACELDVPLLDRHSWMGHRDYGTYVPPHIPSYTNVILLQWLRDRWAVLQEQCRLKAILDTYLQVLQAHGPGVLFNRFSRATQWDFSNARSISSLRGATTEEYRAKYASYRFPGWGSLDRDIRVINRMVQCLKDRGGNVVFLRAPSTGERWQLEEKFHPKKGYWDHFAALSSGVCFHFKDFPAMQDFDCPDGSHLDYRDSAAFTKMLLRQMADNGLLR
jgi:hypothetical protein